MAKVGRPTKYKPEYCKSIIEYFDIPATTTKEVTRITKSGIVKMEQEVPNYLPTIEGFARKIGIAPKNMLAWVEGYPEFRKAYELAKCMQKDILNQNALMGRYSEGYAKFVAINCTDMVDKSQKEVSGPDGGPVEFSSLELANRLLWLVEHGEEGAQDVSK
jgi:hypothetical protein